ncbi:hypothetical protein EHS86_11395 [Erwinia amylovora]|uniref:Uncharacterized protein n=3 Tax=Erwinia amylovora TaxID=552 RepID=A0A831A6M1_ERWAM|nr:hypothetical protein AD997_01680 [Erwinia amylovora]EKV52746.1 hypothetical protein EaACW_3336 [Erwinia amylovora ACW56400]CBA23427.1 hypothetical protein predicted by Glimmer/Critica [Erwinia amylovora CFBP1430]CBJ44979.1 hypothetical protein EAM_0304 [Erwinia amylovora ATCC 49946]CBX82196.1 hypothetical protein predicted by Glimmer/Critica [Erwinia amylovora ATCC BAA-2158]CCO80173.1 hypothetical protein BN432_3404 [Erwinia amylovora Ea356]CCO83977.1 hypothetical protein BN433_3430 [Erwin
MNYGQYGIIRVTYSRINPVINNVLLRKNGELNKNSSIYDNLIINNTRIMLHHADLALPIQK